LLAFLSHILAESMVLLEENVTDDKEKVCCHMYRLFPTCEYVLERWLANDFWGEKMKRLILFWGILRKE
jgi:hypothetical protein